MIIRAANDPPSATASTSASKSHLLPKKLPICESELKEKTKEKKGRR